MNGIQKSFLSEAYTSSSGVAKLITFFELLVLQVTVIVLPCHLLFVLAEPGAEKVTDAVGITIPPFVVAAIMFIDWCRGCSGRRASSLFAYRIFPANKNSKEIVRRRWQADIHDSSKKEVWLKQVELL